MQLTRPRVPPSGNESPTSVTPPPAPRTIPCTRSCGAIVSRTKTVPVSKSEKWAPRVPAAPWRLTASRHSSVVRAVSALNPDVTVWPIQQRLSKENVLDIVAGYDVVLDGADNFVTRYLINDACVLLGKPNVHGGVDRFRGQATVFSLPEGPCYRCLFDEPPPPGTALNCAEAGVLGVVPGIIGLIQAAEALELILGIGEPQIGRLLTLDALPMTFREIPIRKDPHCPMCGPNGPSNLDEIEYSEFSCAISVAVHER